MEMTLWTDLLGSSLSVGGVGEETATMKNLIFILVTIKRLETM